MWGPFSPCGGGGRLRVLLGMLLPLRKFQRAPIRLSKILIFFCGRNQENMFYQAMQFRIGIGNVPTQTSTPFNSSSAYYPPPPTHTHTHQSYATQDIRSDIIVSDTIAGGLINYKKVVTKQTDLCPCDLCPCDCYE